jgi:hypothetical protein
MNDFTLSLKVLIEGLNANNVWFYADCVSA